MRRNFVACIGANKCYRNEINSVVYTRAGARGFSAAGCGRRRRSSSDIRQLGKYAGTSARGNVANAGKNILVQRKFLSSEVRSKEMALNAFAVHSWRMMIGRSTSEANFRKTSSLHLCATCY